MNLLSLNIVETHSCELRRQNTGFNLWKGLRVYDEICLCTVETESVSNI